jgi:hypothetical protein
LRIACLYDQTLLFNLRDSEAMRPNVLIFMPEQLRADCVAPGTLAARGRRMSTRWRRAA